MPGKVVSRWEPVLGASQAQILLTDSLPAGRDWGVISQVP